MTNKSPLITIRIFLQGLFVQLIIMPLAVLASSQHQHSTSLDAHVHGLSQLTIIIEKSTMALQLSSPAANLIGFEHIAKTPQEISRLEQLNQQLKDAKHYSWQRKESCRLEKANIDVSSLLPTPKTSKGHTSHHQHAEEKHSHKSKHSEILAHYRYHCSHTNMPSSMAISLFDSFPNIEKIRVMWIKDTKQGATFLTPTQRDIEFK
ncbi:MAG: DUF2796 domain-containing protein [Pseudomonadota bacterium]